MKIRICPCCDQPIKGMYCHGCKKIVLNPIEKEGEYYLNTRHPEQDHACTFHEETKKQKPVHAMTAREAEVKKSEIKERMKKRQLELQRSSRPPLDVNENLQKNHPNSASHSLQTKPQERVLKTIIPIIVAMFIFSILALLIPILCIV